MHNCIKKAMRLFNFVLIFYLVLKYNIKYYDKNLSTKLKIYIYLYLLQIFII